MHYIFSPSRLFYCQYVLAAEWVSHIYSAPIFVSISHVRFTAFAVLFRFRTLIFLFYFFNARPEINRSDAMQQWDGYWMQRTHISFVSEKKLRLRLLAQDQCQLRNIIVLNHCTIPLRINAVNIESENKNGQKNMAFSSRRMYKRPLCVESMGGMTFTAWFRHDENKRISRR